VVELYLCCWIIRTLVLERFSEVVVPAVWIQWGGMIFEKGGEVLEDCQ